MSDGKYEHQGVSLRSIYALMNRPLRVRRGSVSGGGDFARALVEAGWRPPAHQQFSREMFLERRREMPGLCVAFASNGIETIRGTLCCRPELEPGFGTCKDHSL